MQGSEARLAGRNGAGAVVVTALVLVAGCGQAGPAGAPAPSSSTPSVSGLSPTDPAASPTTSPTTTTSQDDRPITLAFGGDVHFADQVAALLEKPQSSLTSLRPYLGTADLAMVNLETAITSRGTPAPKTYRFRTSPAALTALGAAGVDVVTMANNHTVDYGGAGLKDTLAAQRDSNLPIVGIGPDAERAYAPAILTVRGTRIAVLGASQLNDWTLANWMATDDRPGIASSVPTTRLAAAVRRARTQADLVVVYLHWGSEGLSCPDAAQRRTARVLATAGADIVLGSHAHRVQGAGRLGNSFVDYGLGNFIWYNSSTGSSTSGVLTLTVKGRTVVSSSWTPMLIGRSGVPKVPDVATKAQMLSSWRQTRICSGLAAPRPES